jgi:hypothetical protein
MSEPKLPVIVFDDASDTPPNAEVTRLLARAGSGLALKWGWPQVLDSMLSAYLSLALPRIGKERMARVLSQCLSHLDQFEQALEEKPGAE